MTERPDLEAFVREVAAIKCLTGWGEPGLTNPPPCSCVVCKARALSADTEAPK